MATTAPTPRPPMPLQKPRTPTINATVVLGVSADRVRAVVGIHQVQQEPSNRHDVATSVVDQCHPPDDLVLAVLDHSHTGLPRRCSLHQAAALASGRRASRRVQITENSASEAKIWNTSRPPGVVVSMASCSDRNDVALLELADGLHEVRQRPAEPVEPPHHQRVPGRSEAIISASCGRSVLAPDTVSVQVRQQPAALRASCCNAASCWVVDTLAYPSSSPTGQHPVTTHRHGRWCVDDARGRCRASRGFFRLGDAPRTGTPGRATTPHNSPARPPHTR